LVTKIRFAAGPELSRNWHKKDGLIWSVSAPVQ